MKKSIILSIMALPVFLLVSCEKEQNDSNSFGSKPYKIKTIIDNSTTKTTYAGESTFSWEAGDVVSVQIYNGSYGKWCFTADEATSTSTLTSVLDGSGKNHAALGWSVSNYAFYPHGSYLSYVSQASPTVTIDDEITQNMSNPLKLVPLIGKNQGDDTFKFKVATGILKLNFSNAIAAIEGVELVAGKKGSSYCFSGTYNLAADGYSIEAVNRTSSAPADQTSYIYTSVSNGSDFSVYVPAPIGTIPAKDLKIAVYAKSPFGYIVDNVYNPNEIEIKRGVITSTPTINIATAGNVPSKLPGKYKLGTSNYYVTLSALGVGDDPSKGNIKISKMQLGDGTEIEGTCYGTYDGSTGSITFKPLQLFAVESGTTYYSFRGQWGVDGQRMAITIQSDGTMISPKFNFALLDSPYELGNYSQGTYFFTNITLRKQ